MTIIKHAFPILERDTEQVAVIMPNRDNLYHFPEKCVFAFLGETIEEYALKNKVEKIAEYENITKTYTIYKLNYKGEEICLCQAPLGSSASTQLLEFLIACGVKYIISCGSCGALLDFDENEILIPTIALRDEGTSYHYLAPARDINLNIIAINAIKQAINQYQLTYKECKTWTTDGFYRETKEMIQYRKEEGCSVVEMECSSLAACSQFRNVTYGQILFTADSLAYLDQHDARDWGMASHDIALHLSIEAVYLINKD